MMVFVDGATSTVRDGVAKKSQSSGIFDEAGRTSNIPQGSPGFLVLSAWI